MKKENMFIRGFLLGAITILTLNIFVYLYLLI